MKTVSSRNKFLIRSNSDAATTWPRQADTSCPKSVNGSRILGFCSLCRGISTEKMNQLTSPWKSFLVAEMKVCIADSSAATCTAFRYFALFWCWVLGNAEPLVAIHSGVAENAKEFAILVDTKLC